MTDKLICPFCGEPLYVDDDGEYLTCENFHCDASIYMQTETWKQIITWKQSATVLQKKLDKAMATFHDIRHRFFGIDETTEVLVSELDKTIEKAIKEIEDIKEE